MAKIDRYTVKARDAFTSGKLEVALRMSTHLIDELRSQIVDALELRASIWEKKVNLTEELKDALQIKKYDMCNVGAYLRAAKVYSKQEKLQEALDILFEASCIGPGEDDYTLIQQKIAKAEERLKHRVDFITRAPYDIVCNILRYISPNDAFTCLEVCDRWRQVLLNCPVPWEAVHPSYMCWHKEFDMVPTVSHHIQRLSLHFVKCEQGFKFLNEFQFPRLQYLEILDITRNNQRLHDSLYPALHRVARTLTVLRINARIEVSLGKLLTICSRLVKADLHVDSITDWVAGMPPTTLLTVINITTQLPAHRSNLAQLFQCAPHLRKICIYPMNTRDDILDIVPLLEHHCPELTHIVNGFGGNVGCTNVSDWIEPCESSDRLKSVSLGNVRSTIPLLSRLERATDSLRILHIKAAGNGLDSTLADWLPLSSFVMHNLTGLSIEADTNSALYRHLPNMLYSYPALERLKLRASWNGASILDNVFAAVADMKNLHDLELEYIFLNGQGFSAYIEKQARQESPTLKYLYIACADLPRDVIHNITRIKSLEKLTFGDNVSGLQTTTSDIDEFARQIAEQSYLKYLCLPGDIQLSDNAVRYVVSSKSLEVLDIDIQYITKKTYSILEHLLVHRPIMTDFIGEE
ncbi:hypothetical protein BJV82DRAFT_674535 [Fennellomyces sp. T-0311]|nr:hypothetical protein BJV82DRAFT_674535 [Fennellomyces sp. T-0311]